MFRFVLGASSDATLVINVGIDVTYRSLVFSLACVLSQLRSTETRKKRPGE